MVIHLVMTSVYPALDGDTLGDAGQRVQDAANGLHIHVHTVHAVHGEPAQVVLLGIKLIGASQQIKFKHTPLSPGV